MLDGDYILRVFGNDIEYVNPDGTPCSDDEVKALLKLLGIKGVINAYVYIAKCGERTKIGMTYDLPRRLKEIKGELLYSLPCESYRKAREVEEVIKRTLGMWYHEGEYFYLRPTLTQALIEAHEHIENIANGDTNLMLLCKLIQADLMDYVETSDDPYSFNTAMEYLHDFVQDIWVNYFGLDVDTLYANKSSEQFTLPGFD